MDALPPDVVYAVLCPAQPTGSAIARVACVSMAFARMAKESLWRWHCHDHLAHHDDATPDDTPRTTQLQATRNAPIPSLLGLMPPPPTLAEPRGRDPCEKRLTARWRAREGTTSAAS
ncbi:hypothetical protein CLOM_g20716 [Closterium sp. NIES-68]|nr:hypothetical protein CLOM_g20716 [Closterium sp. NIES-68]